MKVLAFDISASPGVAVVEARQLKSGIKLTLNYVDSVKTSTDHTDAQRYAVVEALAVRAIHDYGPFDAVVRENFTKGGSKRATQTVFGAWAAVDGALGRYGYTVDADLTPATVKKSVTGDGKAGKHEVESGVRAILKLPREYVFKSDDASDAVAIALTYLKQEGLIAE